MHHVTIKKLTTQLRNGEISRRDFFKATAALGVSTAAAGSLVNFTAAQSASPEASPAASPASSPVASPVAYAGPVGTLSVSRDDYNTALKEHFAFEAPAKTGGNIVYVETTDIATVNPLIPADVYSQFITGLFNDGLVGTSPIDGSWVPGIADSWEVADDGVTYTFHLNPTVMWHDGKPFTADDVVFSFDSTIDEKSLSPRRADVLSVLKSHRKIDDHTVELVAKSPVATFLDKTVGEVAMVAKHLWESVPLKNWGADPGSTGANPSRVIGTGPFKFVEWVQNDHVTVVKNPDYWDKAHYPVHIDKYIYRVIADPATAIQSLKTGESDITGIEPSQAEGLKKSNPDISLTVYDAIGFTFYCANQDTAKTDLFADVKVRQALMYGIDRDLIVDTILLGYGSRADGSQPVPSPAYKPDQIRTVYLYDISKAKQLLADAGWADIDGDGILDKGGKKFSFECEYPSGVAAYEQMLPYMQQAWKEIGIEMIPSVLPFTTLLDHATSSNYLMTVLGFSLGVDPDQSWIYGTSAFSPAGFNLMHYSNPKYDALTPLQNAELDVAKRIEIIVEQANIVNDDLALGVMTFGKSIVGARPRVHNFFPNAYGTFWSVPFVWLEA